MPVEGIDVVYNPNMDGGQFEIFTEDHTQYIAYKDIEECADIIMDEIDINNTVEYVKSRMKQVKMLIVKDGGMTIQDLIDECKENGVPMDAKLSIMGVTDHIIITIFSDNTVLLDETSDALCEGCDAECDNCPFGMK